MQKKMILTYLRLWKTRTEQLNLQHNAENSGPIYLSVIKLHCIFRKKFGKSYGKMTYKKSD